MCVVVVGMILAAVAVAVAVAVVAVAVAVAVVVVAVMEKGGGRWDRLGARHELTLSGFLRLETSSTLPFTSGTHLRLPG